MGTDGKNQFEIYLAPVLLSEGWTSVNLYVENVVAAFGRQYPGVQLHDLSPVGEESLGGFRRGWVRDVEYPRAIKRAAGVLGPNRDKMLLHVLDHSYGHLCRAHQPCVVTCRDLNHYVLPSLQGIRLLRWKRRVEGMRAADRIIAISAHLASEIREILNIAPEKITILHHGIDLDVFQKVPEAAIDEDFRGLVDLAKDHFLIVNISTNLPRKNAGTLLKAVAVLKALKIPVKLLRIGHDIMEGEDAETARELGVGEDIVFLGNRRPDEVAQICSLSHVMSFPSAYEGFGRPTLEAQGCELPAVLADSSCMREIGGEGALYHSTYDHEALADQISRLISDAQLRSETVRRGKENVARFSWDRHVKKLMEIYREVMEAA